MTRSFIAAAKVVAAVLIVAFTLIAPADAQPAPSAASLAAAKEILALKNSAAMYREAVPALVQQTRNTLMQTNLNYQKDLNELAVKIARDFAGREKEIGDEFTKLYAAAFTEAELKEILAFYKSPAGKKTIEQEPAVLNNASNYMQQWAQKFSEEINGKFRAEMRARGKEI